MKDQGNELTTIAFIVSVIVLVGMIIIGIGQFLRVQSSVVLIATSVLLAVQMLLAFLIWQIHRTASTLSGSHTVPIAIQEVRQEGNRPDLESKNRLDQTSIHIDVPAATPVIPITNGMVIIPFVGTIDTAHIQTTRASLLDGVAKYQAQVAIVDLTGISELPKETVQSFVKILSTADLMGCRIVLTGISANTARSLLTQEPNLPAKTCRDLQVGIAYATELLSATSARRILPR